MSKRASKKDNHQYNPKRHRSAIRQFAKRDHKRTARAIGLALISGTADAWLQLRVVLISRLSKREIAALAYACLSSLDDDTAYRVANEVLFGEGAA